MAEDHAQDPAKNPEQEAPPDLLDGQSWKTLAECSHSLPLPTSADPSFSWRPSSLGLSLERGKRVTEPAGRRPCEYTAQWLAASLRTLQGRDFVALPHEEASLAVRLLPWTDVLHLLVAYWLEQNGTEGRLRQQATCPHPSCGHTAEVALSLGSMRVRTWAAGGLPRLEVPLEDGFEFPAGQRVEAVTIQPPTWGSLCGLGQGEIQAEGELTAAMLSGAIVGVSTVPGHTNLHRSYLGKLTGRDTSALQQEMALLSGGPVMVVRAPCVRCGRDQAVVIPWTDLAFFEQSAPAPRRRGRLLSR